LKIRIQVYLIRIDDTFLTVKIIPLHDQVLIERLRELNVQPGGLPPHVADCLKACAKEEADLLQLQEREEHAAIALRYEAKLRARVGRLVTLRAIGRAFAAVPALSIAETLVPSTPAKKDGVA
jgi:hypothetical protein